MKRKSQGRSYDLPWLGTPEGTRTPNIQNRNLTLYPLNYGRMAALLNALRYYNRDFPVCKGGNLLLPHHPVQALQEGLGLLPGGIPARAQAHGGVGIIHPAPL